MELVIGIVGIVSGIAGVMFGILTASRNKKTDDKSEGKREGIVLTELGYIKKGIEGIEQRLERQETNYIEVIQKLTALEESTKRAHKRIDKLEKFHLPN